MSSILPAHVRPPRRRSGLLARPILVDRVGDAVTDKRLVLVSAPSGFGKTTLLADVHRQLADQGRSCLWLSVTEGGHDASWLARVLVEQLARLFDTEAQAGEDFGTLANRLVGEHPVIVFIDNWNFIEDEATNALFDRILAESEGLANFIVSSRTIPGFVFETLRLAGSFAGFTSRDLAFTTEEASHVLAGEAPLSIQLFGLIERTEGWPAGVQLLRLALEQAGGEVTPQFDFSGSRTDVADYLGKAFFRHLPTDRRAFLCNVAVLDEVSAEIVAHVLDDPGGAATFMAIEHDNLFLTEIGDGSGRFRFHSLFRDFLLSQHAQEATIAEQTVAERAADYHERRDELELAIHYATRGGRKEPALALLERYGPMLSGEGKVFQYAQWVEGLRRQGVATSESVDYWYCWSLVFGGRWREGMEFTRQSGRAPDAEIATIIAAFSDDQEAMAKALDLWQREKDKSGPFRTAVMQCAVVVAGLAKGDVDKAIEATHHARFAIDRTEAVFGRVWVQVLTAFALLMKGRASQSETTIRDGIRIAERMLGSHVPIARVARLMAAIIAWYRCADEQAIVDLQAADLSADEHGLPMIVVGASSVAAALHVDWQSRRIEHNLISPAIGLVKEAYRVEAALQKMPAPDAAREMVRIFDLRVDDARRERPALMTEGWMLRDLHVGIHARLRIIEGDPEAALHLLAPAINDCQRRGRGVAAVHLSLLRVAALHRSGKASAALRTLIQVAEQAVSDGLFRPFQGERAYVEPLFAGLAEAGQRAPIGDPDAWRRLSAILHIARPGSVNETNAQDGWSPDSDPLTEREMEMLGFVDIGLSNQEIGNRLGISVPTVKWHLHNLFSKIGVRNRGSAVRFAREHHLIKN
jgi:LuxR family maltose regulon positive regulatory protein